MKPHYILYQKWPEHFLHIDGPTVTEDIFYHMKAVTAWLAGAQDDGRTFQILYIDPEKFTCADVTEKVSQQLYHKYHAEGGEWAHPLAAEMLEEEDHHDLPMDWEEHRHGHHEHFGRRAG